MALFLLITAAKALGIVGVVMRACCSCCMSARPS
jgi:hypothetical protein